VTGKILSGKNVCADSTFGAEPVQNNHVRMVMYMTPEIEFNRLTKTREKSCLTFSFCEDA